MVCFSQIVLLACAILVAQAAKTSSPDEKEGNDLALSSSDKNNDDLALLCADKKVELTRLIHLRSMVELLDKRATVDGKKDECDENITSALRDLMEIVNKSSVDGCSLAGYERYENFYMKYLDSSNNEEKKRNNEEIVVLPKRLKKFALGVGLKLSELCRANMVRQFMDHGDTFLTPEDNKEINRIVDPEGEFALSLGYDTRHPDDLILASDFIDLFEGVFESDLIIPKDPEIVRLQSLCKLRFKPVYEQLVLPVARFARLGFVSRNKQVKMLLKTHSSYAQDHSKVYRNKVGRWTIIVFVCEMLDGAELSGPFEENDDTDLSPEAVEEQMTPEAKKAMRTQQVKKKVLTGINHFDVSGPSIYDRPLEPLVGFTVPLRVTLDDDINSSISKAWKLRSIDTNTSHGQRIRWVIFNKAINRYFYNAANYGFKTIYNDLKSMYKRMFSGIHRIGRARSEVTSGIGALLAQEANPDLVLTDERTNKKKVDKNIWTLIFFAAYARSLMRGKVPFDSIKSSINSDEQARLGLFVDTQADRV